MFHVMRITSGAWVTGGTALIICKGEAIGDTLFFGAGVVLVVQFWPSVASCFYDVADVIIGLDHFSGEEGTPQFFVSLYCFLPFNFQGAQMSFKIENQVEFYCGESGQDVQEPSRTSGHHDGCLSWSGT
jgi:hypothetical protein